MQRAVSPKDATRIVNGFRQRGHRDVSRIESFSDTVFGLSVTLLVVSLEVPRTFDELLHTLAGFPSFALTFALLAQIWYVQYRFFRRYALQDGTTIFLNLVLLFVIVFFTYPLKFLFGLVTARSGGGSIIRADQIVEMYGIYALGYASVFGIFLLLHAHALRKRHELELTPLEIFDTRRAMFFAAFQIGIAALSVGSAAFFGSRGAFQLAALYGGVSYALIPFGIRAITLFTGRKRATIVAAQ